MSADIHAITEAHLTDGSTRVDSVADMLRDLADRADRGDIIGVGVCYVRGNGSVSTQWASGLASGIAMGYGGAMLNHRMMRASEDM